MPCLWVDDGDVSGFGTALGNDASIEEVRATADFGREHLYSVRWTDDIGDLITEMVDHEGVILEAAARDATWRLRIRFVTREQFDSFRAYCEGHGPSFRLERLFETEHPRHVRGDVTPEQRAALTAAAELGYFEIPRHASIEDVADELGISSQAVSERLRRGTENLVEDVLHIEPIGERTGS